MNNLKELQFDDELPELTFDEPVKENKVPISKFGSILKGASNIIPGAVYGANYNVGRLMGMPHKDAQNWAQEQEDIVSRSESQGLSGRLLEKGTTVAGRLPFYSGATGGIKRMLPILAKHPIIAGSLGFGAVSGGEEVVKGHPEEALGSAVTSALTYPFIHGAGKIGASSIPKFLPGAERMGTALGMGAFMGGTAPEGERLEEGLLGIGLGALTPSKRGILNKSVGSLYKRYIPYNKYDFEYGGNPPETLAKEGLLAKNLPSLYKKTQTRVDELKQIKSDIVKRAEAGAVEINLKRDYILEPLQKYERELLKDPETHNAEINKVQSIIRDLMGISKGKFAQFNKLTVNETYDMLDRIDNLAKWEGSGYDSGRNSALHQSRHRVNERLIEKMPQLKNINLRIRDLVSSLKGIDKTIDKEKSFLDKPWGLLTPIQEPLKSTLLRTGMGKLLSEKSPTPKQLMLGGPKKILNPKSVGAAASETVNRPILLRLTKETTVKDLQGNKVPITPEEGLSIEPITKGGKIIKYQVHDGQEITVSKRTGESLIKKTGESPTQPENGAVIKDLKSGMGNKIAIPIAKGKEVMGTGAFISRSGKTYDISDDFGDGTNDHVGFLKLAMEGDKIPIEDFGITKKEQQLLKKFYNDGIATDEVGKVFAKIQNDVIRIRVYGKEAVVDSGKLSDRVVNETLKYFADNDLKPTKVTWLDINAQVYKDMTLEEFASFKEHESNKDFKKNALAVGLALGTSALANQAQASTLGEKNNNPGNLRGKDEWQGKTGKDKYGHIIFDTMANGVRALKKNLANHAKYNPNQTLKDYMNSYAEENGTEEAKFIAKNMGIDINTKLKNIDMNEAAKHVAMFESKIDITKVK